MFNMLFILVQFSKVGLNPHHFKNYSNSLGDETHFTERSSKSIQLFLLN
nr:MAG TPA: hypothetical protein [Bacteriophage sp.]DAQ62270.1 MAG TPA: hypothetical protein [Caudoviricetes sp.]